MKRVVCFCLLLIFLAFLFGSVIAEGSQKAETIRFMGIDWDITPNEFEQALLNKGIIVQSKKRSTYLSHYSFFDGMPQTPPYSYAYSLEIESEEYHYESPENDYDNYFKPLVPLLKVAGYEVDYIDAEFKPSYSLETGKIGEPYRLSRALYNIYQSDIPKEMSIYEAYDDLIEKLTVLYGESDGSEKSTLYWIRKTWWYAKDGTGISLRLVDGGTVYRIEIVYGVADEADYFNDLYMMKQSEKQNVIDAISDDMSGL